MRPASDVLCDDAATWTESAAFLLRQADSDAQHHPRHHAVRSNPLQLNFTIPTLICSSSLSVAPSLFTTILRQLNFKVHCIQERWHPNRLFEYI